MADFTDDDVEKFLQSRGVKTQAAPTPAPEGAPPGSAQAAPVRDEDKGSREDEFKKRLEGDWQLRAGRGVAKGLARTASNVGRLATHLAPSLGELAGKLPEGVQRKMSEMREFGDEPSEDWAQYLGSAAGEIAPNLMLPGLGAETLAARAGTRLFPPIFTRGAGFAPATGARVARGAGRAVDVTAQGAEAGAIANPEDPETGAAVGAAAGAIPGTVGPALRSRIGRMVGSHMLPAALAGGAFHAATTAGLPHWAAYSLAIPAIRWYRSPLGLRLHRIGNYITDQSGRVIGQIPAGPAGGAASQAMQ